MINQIHAFALAGEPVRYRQYGNGHINGTWLIADDAGREYILQKVNASVFCDPISVMRNVAAVTEYLLAASGNPRETLSLLPTKAGGKWHVDEHGEYWRVYEFIGGSICIDRAETPGDFRESAVAFGRFQQLLDGFPAHTLVETIPHFHDTPHRFRLLREAARQDSLGRCHTAAREIEFALSREAYSATLSDLQAAGELPLRVTHNDTKLNNVLFDQVSRKALCVIDLDTVMPGLSVNDFGDAIRFGASTAAEDERDLGKVTLSLELFAAYTEGYLAQCGTSLTGCELEHLRDGAKMMTLECGVRFLTDYLSGDTYFRTHRQSQNLDRCRAQFRLLEDMEAKWDNMQAIILREVRNELVYRH